MFSVFKFNYLLSAFNWVFLDKQVVFCWGFGVGGRAWRTQIGFVVGRSGRFPRRSPLVARPRTLLSWPSNRHGHDVPIQLTKPVQATCGYLMLLPPSGATFLCTQTGHAGILVNQADVVNQSLAEPCADRAELHRVPLAMVVLRAPAPSDAVTVFQEVLPVKRAGDRTCGRKTSQAIRMVLPP